MTTATPLPVSVPQDLVLCGCGCGVPAAKCQCSLYCYPAVPPVCRVPDCWAPCAPWAVGMPQVLDVGTERLCLAHAGGWLTHLFSLSEPWLSRWPRFLKWLELFTPASGDAQ